MTEPPPAWQEFESAIRSEIHKEQIDRKREAINEEIAGVYEEMRPYLEALNELSLARAFRHALNAAPHLDPDDRIFNAAVVKDKALASTMEEARERVRQLEAAHADQLVRLAFLRGLRSTLTSPERGDEVEDPEPP